MRLIFTLSKAKDVSSEKRVPKGGKGAGEWTASVDPWQKTRDEWIAKKAPGFVASEEARLAQTNSGTRISSLIALGIKRRDAGQAAKQQAGGSGVGMEHLRSPERWLTSKEGTELAKLRGGTHFGAEHAHTAIMARRAGMEHAASVRQAVEAGKPVSPKTLKDYPDVKAKSPSVRTKITPTKLKLTMPRKTAADPSKTAPKTAPSKRTKTQAQKVFSSASQKAPVFDPDQRAYDDALESLKIEHKGAGTIAAVAMPAVYAADMIHTGAKGALKTKLGKPIPAGASRADLYEHARFSFSRQDIDVINGLLADITASSSPRNRALKMFFGNAKRSMTKLAGAAVNARAADNERGKVGNISLDRQVKNMKKGWSPGTTLILVKAAKRDVSKEERDEDGRWTNSRSAFHGTREAFEVFDKDRAHDSEGKSLNLGWGKGVFYFSDDEREARMYANRTGRGKLYAVGSPRVISAQLAIEKPFDLSRSANRDRFRRAKGGWKDSETDIYWGDIPDKGNRRMEAFVRQLKKEGYDGIIEGSEIVVFRPDQIRITDHGGEIKKARDVSGEARDENGRWTEGAPNAHARPAKGVFDMPVSKILADPKRFQYKGATNDRTGAGEELRGVQKFDPDLAGVVLVWHDPANGKTYVVNGHHRLDLARRLGRRSLTVRYVDAPTAEKAMIKGALCNIAEGRGTPTDAAKLMRTVRITRKGLEDAGVSLVGTIANQAAGLAKLAAPLWQKVVKEDMTPARGALIGNLFATDAEQLGLNAMLERPEIKRKRLTDAAIAELAKFVDTAGKRTKTVATLFGEESITSSLAVEKAQLSAGVKARLLSDRRLFGFVAKQARADALLRGGNTINVDANKVIANEATRIAEAYDHLSVYKGPVADALNGAARELADGGNQNVITERLFGDVRRAIEQDVTGGAAVADDGRGIDPPRLPEPDGDLFKSFRIGEVRTHACAAW